jgi:energy-coupling factor transporter transmembrane protein EcfT
MASCASLAVMLPLERLLAAMGLYLIVLLWARLLPSAARQVWRLKWVLIVLFVVDWFIISPELAALITLRIILLTCSFALFFATSTPADLGLALEWMRVPHRYAFSVSLAFQSIGLLDDEWRAIREAQLCRGIDPAYSQRTLKSRLRGLGDLVALAVPAIVLTTRRAWAMTEAAYARGFEAPHRRPFHQLRFQLWDWLLILGSAGACIGLLFWR